MKKTKLSIPLPMARADVSQGTLDERIALVEQHLVTRERTVRASAQNLLHRAQEATQPSRVLRPAGYVLGAAALVWGVGRLFRSRREARKPDFTSATPMVPANRSASRLAEMPWKSAAKLFWPHLPAAWRGRLGSDSASLLVAVGVPLAGLLLRKRTPESRTPPRGPTTE